MLKIKNLSINFSGIHYLKTLMQMLITEIKFAIFGKNGSGKSSIARAILNDSDIKKTGDWILPNTNYIGYLDQHYKNLDRQIAVFDSIKNLKSELNNSEIRKILNDFLFRKNEEVYNLIGNLSGGEMVRLILCHIFLKSPKLLILDEINNNIDMKTKSHVINVLKDYVGAMIIISHDESFIDKVGVSKIINI